MSRKIVIGLSGAGFCGKDSAFLCIKNILQQYSIEVVRFGLADELKILSNPILRQLVDISAFSTDINDKSLIRPFLVEMGRLKREVSHGTFWTSLLTPKIKKSLENSEVPVICDIRYDDPKFPNDEYKWLKNEFNGVLVYIERVLDSGELVPNANKEEEKNNPILRSKADYILRWVTTPDQQVREDYVKVQLAPLLDKIINS